MKPKLTPEERKQHKLDTQRRWRERHPEQQKACEARYREKRKLDPAYRQKNSERGRAWYQQNKHWYNPKKIAEYWDDPNAAMDRSLRKNYGITLVERDALVDAQNNTCAICSTSFADLPKKNVDHCHKTNKIRGILCTNCNLGLGNFKDKVEYLQNAVKYLEINRGD